MRELPVRAAPAPTDFWFGLPRFEWSVVLLGLCLFSFSIITYRVPLGEAGAVIGLVGLGLQRGRLRAPFPIWIYGAFVAWAALASLVSPYRGLAGDSAVEHMKVLLIMLIIVNALRTPAQVRFYLMFVLGCFVLFPVRGTLVGGDSIGGRAVWNYIYKNPNDLAMLCMLALGLALGFLFDPRSIRLVRACAAISATLLLVVILLTQSRGAFIGLIAGLAPALLLRAIKRPWRALVFVAVVAVVVDAFVPATAWERLAGVGKLTSTATIAMADPEGSAEERFEIQQVAGKIILDHPMIGVGLGAYPHANAVYAPHIGLKDTHNTYLNVAAETGIPGVLVWLGFMLWTIRFAIRSRRIAPHAELATLQEWMERALWGFMAAGLFGTYAMLTFPYLMMAVLWCSAILVGARPEAPLAAVVAKP